MAPSSMRRAAPAFQKQDAKPAAIISKNTALP
jgi:hypothetical protein